MCVCVCMYILEGERLEGEGEVAIIGQIMDRLYIHMYLYIDRYIYRYLDIYR